MMNDKDKDCGEWVEGLTRDDIGAHSGWLAMTCSLYGPVQKTAIIHNILLDRFIKTFGEPE